MTRKPKAGGVAPPAEAPNETGDFFRRVVERAVRDVLQQHFPGAAFQIGIIARLIEEAWKLGVYPIRGTWTVQPDAVRLGDAIETIRRLAPAEVAGLAAAIADAERRGATPEQPAYGRDNLAALESLLAAASRAPTGPKPRRATDPRSLWHPTARAFASEIERGLARAKLDSPSRRSVASPLVHAVRDLLALLDVDADTERVRKVLSGKSRQQKSSQDTSGAD